MRSRLILAALACAALPGAVVPTPALAALDPVVAVYEFTGYVTLGCLNCDGPAGLDVDAHVVSSNQFVKVAHIDAQGFEDTTPDPCPVLLQYFGEFTAGDVTGQLSWLRSGNQITMIASGVNGNGLRNGTGVGRAVVLADPAALVLESCGMENVRYLVEGSLTLTSP